MDSAPIWDHCETFRGREWRGVVDCISAGIPCVSWSLAGRRRGADDERHLGEELIRIVGEVGPSVVVVENVPGFVVHDGLGRIAGELSSLGYDRLAWDLFRADDVEDDAGQRAPHRRERVFLVAVSHARRDALRNVPERGPGSAPAAVGWHAELGDVGAESLADADRGGREVTRERGVLDREREAPGHDPDRRSLWPPGPSDAEGWQRWIAAGGPQPAVRRDADGIRFRMDKLRLLGQAVVPGQAALAVRVLGQRLGIDWRAW